MCPFYPNAPGLEATCIIAPEFTNSPRIPIVPLVQPEPFCVLVSSTLGKPRLFSTLNLGAESEYLASKRYLTSNPSRSKKYGKHCRRSSGDKKKKETFCVELSAG